MAEYIESVCRSCFHSYVCKHFNERRDDNNSKCHFFNDHYAPYADVVEVVRCKDCEYWQDNNGGYPHDECRWDKEETPDADDYCSFGAKMDGKGEG